MDEAHGNREAAPQGGRLVHQGRQRVRYHTKVTPVGEVFAISVDAGERTIHTQALRASDIEQMATVVISESLKVPESKVELDIHWPRPIDRLAKRAAEARRSYDAAMDELTSSREEVVQALTAQGWKQQDIATVAGVSKARISQLKKTRPVTTPTVAAKRTKSAKGRALAT